MTSIAKCVDCGKELRGDVLFCSECIDKLNEDIANARRELARKVDSELAMVVAKGAGNG